MMEDREVFVGGEEVSVDHLKRHKNQSRKK